MMFFCEVFCSSFLQWYRQHGVKKCVHVSSSLLLRRIAVDTEMYNVIQVSNPCIRPVMGMLRRPLNLIILPSVPD